MADLASDRPEKVTAINLAAVIGVRAAEARRILDGIVPAGRGPKRWYRWRDILPVLGKNQLARARRRERELRMRPHGSKYWIAGYPELVAQWHPTRNVDVWPDEVRYASRRVLWWKCPKGSDHEWRASATARTTGSKRGVTRCPFCIHRRVSVTNSLATRNPEVAREWHPTKNGALRPKDVVFSSKGMHWWKCAEGPDHEWRAILTNRTRTLKRAGCPFCAGQRASVTNSLAARAPRAARDWHPTRNGKRTPHDVPVGSRRKVWWKCSKDPRHVWRSEVRDRATRTKGCPFCGHRRMWPGVSLAALSPNVAKQWHPTKNGNLKARDVMAGTPRKVWWKCPKGRDHEWYAAVWSRTRAVAPVGCPFCSGLRASVTNSLASLAPRLARQWHPTKNGALRPKDVTPGSQRRVWWKCPLGRDHVWSTAVRSRMQGPGRCPFCVGRRPSVTQSPEKRASIVVRW